MGFFILLLNEVLSNEISVEQWYIRIFHICFVTEEWRGPSPVKGKSIKTHQNHYLYPPRSEFSRSNKTFGGYRKVEFSKLSKLIVETNWDEPKRARLELIHWFSDEMGRKHELFGLIISSGVIQRNLTSADPETKWLLCSSIEIERQFQEELIKGQVI